MRFMEDNLQVTYRVLCMSTASVYIFVLTRRRQADLKVGKRAHMTMYEELLNSAYSDDILRSGPHIHTSDPSCRSPDMSEKHGSKDPPR